MQSKAIKCENQKWNLIECGKRSWRQRLQLRNCKHSISFNYSHSQLLSLFNICIQSRSFVIETSNGMFEVSSLLCHGSLRQVIQASTETRNLNSHCAIPLSFLASFLLKLKALWLRLWRPFHFSFLPLLIPIFNGLCDLVVASVDRFSDSSRIAIQVGELNSPASRNQFPQIDYLIRN